MPKKLTEREKAIRAFNKAQRRARIQARKDLKKRCACGTYLSVNMMELGEETCRSCQQRERDLEAYKILEAGWFGRTC